MKTLFVIFASVDFWIILITLSFCIYQISKIRKLKNEKQEILKEKEELIKQKSLHRTQKDFVQTRKK